MDGLKSRWCYWLIGSISFLAAAVLSNAGALAWANMASPEYAGDFLGEPLGNVATLDILHEDLRFDLRPLAEQQPADVSAIYQVQNTGVETTVELLFMAPGLAAGQVLLDGADAIAADVVDNPVIPENWQVPQTITPISGLQFTIPLASGEHTISVQYTAQPGSDGWDLYRKYTLDYLLSPAAQWRSFGTLAVDVYAPRGWETDFSLAIPPAATGHWQAEFTGLPADSMTLLTYPTVPLYRALLRKLCTVGSWLVASAGIWWISCRIGHSSKQNQWQQGWLVLTVLLGIPLGIVCFWTVIGLGSWGSETLLDSRHLGEAYLYQRNILYLLMGLLAAVVAPVASLTGFVRGRRRAAKTGS